MSLGMSADVSSDVSAEMSAASTSVVPVVAPSASALTPYFDLAPRDPAENLAWRIRLREAALHDRELQDTIRQACFDDPLFFFQFAMWLHEPRAKIKTIPFCLWPHQIPAILAMEKLIDDAEQNMEEPLDLVVDKSRAQGFSVITLGVILRRYLRDEMFTACLVSRNMEAVDDGTMNSLMGKLDFMIQMLPYWLRPRGHDEKKDRLYSKHTWTNPDNGASIIGSAATGDVFSGGRATVILFDEVAKFAPADAEDAMNSTQHVANCRIFGSTHKGDSGVYYDMVFGDAAGVKVVLAWQDNPTQNRLAYTIREGIVFPVREEERAEVMRYVAEHKADLEKLKRRGFIKEGRMRSPWYDRQCLRKGVTPRGIAQELDRDPRGTVGKLFNTEVLDRMVKEHVQPPLWEGRPVVRNGELRLVQQDGGSLKLWFTPGLDNEPPRGKYAVGADIGTGSGDATASNSALIAGNCRTGQQVLEYADPGISETRFARLAVVVCKWLNNALLIWEAQGPTGKRFANEVMQKLGYGNVWFRPKDDSWSSGDTSRKAGWTNNKTSDKADLFEDLWVAMDEQFFTPRSDAFIKECGGWEWDDKHSDKIIYRGTGHGDRAIAGGLCWKGMKDFQQIAVDKTEEDRQDNAPYGTLAWRIEQAKLRKRNFDDESGEEFGLRELLAM